MLQNINNHQLRVQFNQRLYKLINLFELEIAQYEVNQRVTVVVKLY